MTVRHSTHETQSLDMVHLYKCFLVSNSIYFVHIYNKAKKDERKSHLKINIAKVEFSSVILLLLADRIKLLGNDFGRINGQF